MRIVKRSLAFLMVLPVLAGCAAPKSSGPLTQAFDGFWIGFSKAYAGACSDQYSGGKNLKIQFGQGVWRTGNGSKITFDLGGDGTTGFKVFGSGNTAGMTNATVDGKFGQDVAMLLVGGNYCTYEFTLYRVIAVSKPATARFDGKYQGNAELLPAPDNMSGCAKVRENRFVIVRDGKAVWNFSTDNQGFEMPIDRSGDFRADAGPFYLNGSVVVEDMLVRAQGSDCLYEYKLHRT